MKREEVFWVASDGDQPSEIFFTLHEAVTSDAVYLDSFDKDGKVVKRMKKVGEGTTYTTKF